MSKNSVAKLFARAQHIVSQRGLSAEARDRINEVFDKYVGFAQAAPNHPDSVIVDIPFKDLDEAVGVADMPTVDAVHLAYKYLEESVRMHVSGDLAMRVAVDREREVVVVECGSVHTLGKASPLMHSRDYRTYDLPPFAVPEPRKRARPAKAAPPAEEGAPAIE
jgi:hypothetical protein